MSDPLFFLLYVARVGHGHVKRCESRLGLVLGLVSLLDNDSATKAYFLWWQKLHAKFNVPHITEFFVVLATVATEQHQKVVDHCTRTRS